MISSLPAGALDGFVDEVSRSLCKLLVALGDHSAMYFAKNIASPTQLKPAPPSAFPLPFPLPLPLPLVSHLVQNFLRLLLAYTALPGYYGADEEESEAEDAEAGYEDEDTASDAEPEPDAGAMDVDNDADVAADPEPGRADVIAAAKALIGMEDS